MLIQTLLGIELPIIQAPMLGVQDSQLTIAVSQAGGLGSLPCAMLGPQALADEIASIRRQTSAPFNLNFFCHAMPAPDPARQQAWQDRLAPYHAELGLKQDPSPSGVARLPFDQAMADIISQCRPPVVSFHFGLPAPALLQQVRHAGARIMASATTLEEARWLEAHGVDIIIAQGLEAGGHRGMFLTEDLDSQIGTFALLSQLQGNVRLPFVAAGGIGDAQGVRAAMALGAAGVQVGTAYLLCPEARSSAVHRAALQNAQAGDTALTNVFSGRPARGIVNRMMRELGPMSPLAPAFPLAAAASARLRASAESMGKGDFSPLWAGQNLRACQAIPAGQLTRALAMDLPGARTASLPDGQDNP